MLLIFILYPPASHLRQFSRCDSDLHIHLDLFPLVLDSNESSENAANTGDSGTTTTSTTTTTTTTTTTQAPIAPDETGTYSVSGEINYENNANMPYTPQLADPTSAVFAQYESMVCNDVSLFGSA